MHKAYIAHWMKREKPEEHLAYYLFDSRSEKAANWKTKERADIDCALFNHLQIEIPSSNGGTHVCNGFKVEKLTSGNFAIFCEAPFIPMETSDFNQAPTPAQKVGEQSRG
jgi:hypothetical protein